MAFRHGNGGGRGTGYNAVRRHRHRGRRAFEPRSLDGLERCHPRWTDLPGQQVLEARPSADQLVQRAGTREDIEDELLREVLGAMEVDSEDRPPLEDVQPPVDSCCRRGWRRRTTRTTTTASRPSHAWMPSPPRVLEGDERKCLDVLGLAMSPLCVDNLEWRHSRRPHPLPRRTPTSILPSTRPSRP